jgi:NAD-dependent dihydropyrimidine dehydrogenase PreA subunit
VGNPTRESPVFLTGNYHLTVARVKRALRGLDCFLLVANSRGYNVWCGAAGGHLTNHGVVSVLKTSGVEERVAHREVILPQLAATGVEAKVISERAGWKVIWGPVYARDIRAFVEGGLRKTREMRDVRFPWVQRVEMGAAWAFPFSVVVVPVTALWWREGVPLVTVLIWLISFSAFLLFPLYARWMRPGRGSMGFSKYTVFFDFSLFTVILWAAFVACLAGYEILGGDFHWAVVLRAGFISLVIVLLLSLDLAGSTPVYKSGLHGDRLLKVVLDGGKCRGASFCERVCPRGCYEMDWDRRLVKIVAPGRCVRCGACIVQCPFDALYFESPEGGVVPPAAVRKFKLNLLGKRLVRAEGRGRGSDPERE